MPTLVSISPHMTVSLTYAPVLQVSGKILLIVQNAVPNTMLRRLENNLGSNTYDVSSALLAFKKNSVTVGGLLKIRGSGC